MDNVQKVGNCINIPSPQTFLSYVADIVIVHAMYCAVNTKLTMAIKKRFCDNS
jgi:hypothetical protein